MSANWLWPLAIIMSLLVVGPAWAADAEVEHGGESILFSINGDSRDDDWSQQLCDSLVDAFPGHCAIVDDLAVIDAKRRTHSFRYHVALGRGDDGEVALSVDDWAVANPAKGILEGRFLPDDGIGADQAVHFLNTNIIDGALGGHRTPDSAPNYVRVALWNTAALGAATWWYLTYQDLNSKDWDFEGIFTDDPELELRPQSEVWKGFGGWRFDDNVMFLNTPLHAMAGGGYYILARSSNMGPVGSFLMANLVSMLWEAGVEHHEVISLNDLILTGVAGVPLGEAYHQIGQFFRSGERTWFNQAMSWIFATPLQIHDLVDGTGPMYLGERNELGWPTDTWHRFIVQPGWSTASTLGSDQVRHDGEIAGSVELVRLPDFRKSGEHDRWFVAPVAVDLSSSIAAGQRDGGIYSWHLYGSLDMAGYYRHRVRQSKRGQIGSSYFVGTAMAFRHIQHRYADGLDRYGIVHLPGLRVDSSFFAGPLDLRFRWGVFPDFTTIDSRAYSAYRSQTGRQAPRTVLENEGYYYGFGVTSSVGLEAGIKPFRLFWDWDRHWTSSIDTLDRFHDDPSRFGSDHDAYLSLSDQVDSHRLGAMVDLPGVAPLQAGMIGEYRGRRGSVEDGEGQWEAETAEMRGLGVLRLVY